MKFAIILAALLASGSAMGQNMSQMGNAGHIEVSYCTTTSPSFEAWFEKGSTCHTDANERQTFKWVTDQDDETRQCYRMPERYQEFCLHVVPR